MLVVIKSKFCSESPTRSKKISCQSRSNRSLTSELVPFGLAHDFLNSNKCHIEHAMHGICI
jgi:hypothetical protein